MFILTATAIEITEGIFSIYVIQSYCLNIYYSTQFLDSVQQNVPLFDGGLKWKTADKDLKWRDYLCILFCLHRY